MGFFLRYCRRAVPGRAELLHRFDQVYNFFREAKDSANNTILFNDAADKEIKNLRKHIENDCIGDVPGIPLYFTTGRSKDGFTKYRCCRGTNSNEGYHRHMRKILHNHAASPQLVHLLLMEFNYRWNIRQAVSNRGLGIDVGGFYNQEIIESINFISSSIYSTIPYINWKSVFSYADTTERFGFLSNTDNTGLDGNPHIGLNPREDIVTQKGIPVIDSVLNECIPYPQLTKSAKEFQKLLCVEYKDMGAITPVNSRFERRKYAHDISNFTPASGAIDFEAWALSWNKDADPGEQNGRLQPICSNTLNSSNKNQIRKPLW